RDRARRGSAPRRPDTARRDGGIGAGSSRWTRRTTWEELYALGSGASTGGHGQNTPSTPPRRRNSLMSMSIPRQIGPETGPRRALPDFSRSTATIERMVRDLTGEPAAVTGQETMITALVPA